jgi:hypothetical protein
MHGDKASCADIDVAVAQGQERKEQAQAAIMRSTLAAQWAQAHAQEAQAQSEESQARALQQQARQIQLQGLPRPVTTNCLTNGLRGVNCTQY